MTKLKPTKDWILTQKIVVEENKHLVIIPLNGDKDTKHVKILSFGPEANKSNQLKVGDIVLVPAHTGLKHEVGDEEFEFAKEHNFLGVVE
jgi:co-chaperonin GroES (HSP10)